jgi:uncharacterized protein
LPGSGDWKPIEANSGNGRPTHMTKLFLLVVAVAAFIWVFFGRRKNQAEGTGEQSPARATENIVVCAHCHLRIPESESVNSAGRHYCCDEHRKLGAS